MAKKRSPASARKTSAGGRARTSTETRGAAARTKTTTSPAKRSTPLSTAGRTARRRQRSGDLEVPSGAHAGGPIPPTGAASPLPALPGEDRAPGDLPTSAQRRRGTPRTT